MDAERSARELIAEFGTLAAAAAAPMRRLRKVCGGNPAAGHRLQTFRRAMLHVLQTRIRQGPVLDGSRALLDYLHVAMAHSAVERVRVLHLNCRNMLVMDEIVARGTVDGARVHVRAIVGRALELGTSSIIIVHNHPSGDPAPSEEDVVTTRLLAEAARPLGILLHDHVVVGADGCSSMRAMGLL